MILRGNVFSKILGMDTGISIVTPNEVTQQKPYNVIYLLHGLFGNHNTWIDYSMLTDYACRGKAIFIMPEVARSFYCNMQSGFRYFDYITQELPSICKNMFNISTKREDTAIMGGSMGGYGALKIALSNPEQYSYCGAFASSCLFLEAFFDKIRNNFDTPDNRQLIENVGPQIIDDFITIFGADLVLKPEDNIISLLTNIEKHQQTPQLFLTCGTEDAFYTDHQAFIHKLNHTSLNYQFEDWLENHTFSFFNESLRRALNHLAW